MEKPPASCSRIIKKQICFSPCSPIYVIIWYCNCTISITRNTLYAWNYPNEIIVTGLCVLYRDSKKQKSNHLRLVSCHLEFHFSTIQYNEYANSSFYNDSTPTKPATQGLSSYSTYVSCLSSRYTWSIVPPPRHSCP
ncbi:hypothetical protein SAMN04244570_1083 [Sporosarcina newyorkensis]|uniref:Uncharacterized protein n=1 Tax=Sporosarcina newyorkensis TaxID=759851 RepID=A0A1T4XNG7_9BACL|nr:hypothetical protein SAMN04244570_1083 [Sporosarcina newyorkensis]